MSDSLWSHGLQHARPPCPSPTPGLTQIHDHRVSDAIQPSHPLLSPSPPAFNLSQHHVFSNELNLCIGGQSIGVSASASVLPMNIQDWFPLGWTDWISLQSKGLSGVFSNTAVQKHQFFSAQLSSVTLFPCNKVNLFPYNTGGFDILTSYFTQDSRWLKIWQEIKQFWEVG